MILNTLLIVAGAYLIGMSPLIRATGLFYTLMFKAGPFVLGVPLMFFGVARLMGWPV